MARALIEGCTCRHQARLFCCSTSSFHGTLRMRTGMHLKEVFDEEGLVLSWVFASPVGWRSYAASANRAIQLPYSSILRLTVSTELHSGTRPRAITLESIFKTQRRSFTCRIEDQERLLQATVLNNCSCSRPGILIMNCLVFWECIIITGA